MVVPPPILNAVARTALYVLAAGAPPDSGAPPPASATVVFGGDIVPHRDLLTSFAAHGESSVFGPIAPVIRAADLALVNFETPAAPSRPLSPSVVRFNVHADFVHALVAAGFDGAAVANNHSFDTGVGGVGETVATLRAAGLRVIGGALAGEDPLAPQEFALAGGRLCVFGATRILNFDMTMPGPSQPRVGLARSRPPTEAEELAAAVRRHRSRCGAILVSLHSGYEYQDRPEPIDRVYFHHLADAGADVVVAHHSHTVQRVELYATGGRQAAIFYSLGNFVSNQGYSADAAVALPDNGPVSIALDPRMREGLLAVMRFEATANHGLRLAEFGYIPLWTVNNRLHVPPGEAVTISAALMPRDGGSESFIQGRWRALVQRVGAEYLLPEASLPGAGEAYRLSTQAVIASRRAPATARNERAQSPDQSQH